MKFNYHVDGTLPEDGYVFVFGSNLAGIHGAGAAKIAQEQYSAIPKVGFGITSDRSYAIPTKDKYIRSMELEIIKVYVEEFIFTHEPDLIRSSL